MTITAQILQNTGPATAAGTVLGSQSIAAPAAWTRLTGLDGTIPKGGAVLNISSDAEAFRYAVMDPASAQDTAAADRAPPHNGDLVTGIGAPGRDTVPYGAQVWVKQA